MSSGAVKLAVVTVIATCLLVGAVVAFERASSSRDIERAVWRSRVQEGYRCLIEGDSNKAVKHYHKAEGELHPRGSFPAELALTKLELGVALLQGGNMLSASKAFEDALRGYLVLAGSDPDNARFWKLQSLVARLGLARALSGSGQGSRAAQLLGEELKDLQSPDLHDSPTATALSAEVSLALAIIMRERGELSAATELEAQSSEILRNLLSGRRQTTSNDSRQAVDTSKPDAAELLIDKVKRANRALQAKDSQTARNLLSEAVASARGLPRDDSPALSVLIEVGQACLYQKDWQNAKFFLSRYVEAQDGLQRNRQTASRAGTAAALSGLAEAHSGLREWTCALECYERLLTLQESDRTSVAFQLGTLACLADLSLRLGHIAAARRYSVQRLELARGVDTSVEASALRSLSVCAQAEGDLAQSERLATQALDLSRSCLGAGDRQHLESIRQLAAIARARRDVQGLKRWCSLLQSECSKQAQDADLQASALQGLAEAFFFQGDYRRSKDYLGRAISILEKAGLGETWQATGMRLQLADVCMLLKEFDKQEQLCRQALRHVIAEKGARSCQTAVCYGDIARIGVMRGRLNDKTLGVLRSSWALFEELADADELAQALDRVRLDVKVLEQAGRRQDSQAGKEVAKRLEKKLRGLERRDS